MKEDWLSWLGGLVGRVTENSAYFPSVLLAQSALESNYGQSTLSSAHNNYFGIKAGSTWQGDTVNMATGEVINGNSVTLRDNFRKYSSPEASIKDRIEWMEQMPIYNSVAAATTPEAQAQALQDSGYATDPNYANKIISIINTWNLKQYDTNRDTMKNISLAVGLLLAVAAALLIYKELKF